MADRGPGRAAGVALALAMALLTATGPAAAQKRAVRRDQPQRLVLRPANWTQLASVGAVQASVRTTHRLRQPVTDLMLRLEPTPGNSLIAALAYPNTPRGRRQTLFLVSLVVVAGGRLLVEDAARCAPWDADMSLCAVSCDGGEFALLRQRTPDGLKFSLALGKLATADDGLSDGPRLGACADDGPDVRLTTLLGPPVARIDLEEK